MEGYGGRDPFVRQGRDGGRTGFQASPGLAPFPLLPQLKECSNARRQSPALGLMRRNQNYSELRKLLLLESTAFQEKEGADNTTAGTLLGAPKQIPPHWGKGGNI